MEKLGLSGQTPQHSNKPGLPFNSVEPFGAFDRGVTQKDRVLEAVFVGDFVFDRNNGLAVLFLGKSESGKSTVSSIFTGSFSDVDAVNSQWVFGGTEDVVVKQTSDQFFIKRGKSSSLYTTDVLAVRDKTGNKYVKTKLLKEERVNRLPVL
ncbi:MAG: hypothetical protein KKD39_03075 [Candidatus Altiarchaeota archaeon]|nr:hypothetical protein [Candidatus Altiarchaeota archaeon]